MTKSPLLIAVLIELEATEIVKQGFAKDKKEVFQRMIGDNCPAYLASTKMTTEEGIALIKKNGGLCVLAHPCLYKKNNVEDLIKLGVDGIEAVYPGKENQETKYRDLAMLVGFGLQLWQYGSPIAYGLELIPSQYRTIYMLNPVTPIITTFRYVMFGFGYFAVDQYR